MSTHTQHKHTHKHAHTTHSVAASYIFLKIVTRFSVLLNLLFLNEAKSCGDLITFLWVFVHHVNDEKVNCFLFSHPFKLNNELIGFFFFVRKISKL